MPLISALLRYINPYLGYSMVYTSESLKTFHFTYHNNRKYTGITDPGDWTLWEQTLFDQHSRTKDSCSTTMYLTPVSCLALLGSSRPTGPPQWQGEQGSFRGFQGFIMWNQGRDCPQIVGISMLVLYFTLNPGLTCPGWRYDPWIAQRKRLLNLKADGSFSPGPCMGQETKGY